MPSRQQAIAAALGDEDFGVRRVALDLAAQTVDVRFQRVRCDACIVAPDFAEQRVAADRPFRRGTEIRGSQIPFRLAGPSAPGRVAQQLGLGPERIGADRQHALFVSRLSRSPARSRASNSPTRIGLTSQSAGAGGDSAAARFRTGIGRGQNDDRATDPGLDGDRRTNRQRTDRAARLDQCPIESLAPYAAQGRSGAVAFDAGELRAAFELIDETAAARRVRIDDQNPGQHPERECMQPPTDMPNPGSRNRNAPGSSP